MNVLDLDEQMIVEALLSAYGGEIIAKNVSEEEYMEQYAEQFCEWVNGVVIKMSPIHIDHDAFFRFLIRLFEAYFVLKPVGQFVVAPFVMRMSAKSRREPDLQIILNRHLDRLKPTYVDGAADICIEIVSPGSIEIDYGKKFKEYEQAGVGEYWIFDPIRQDALFYRRNDQGVFQRYNEDTEGNYATALLPQFVLHIPTLWRDPLPNVVEVAEMVKKMIEN
jgi:Uma2 family endonuclease